jgi:hypothetical protein
LFLLESGDRENRRSRYHEYLTGETNQLLKRWQKDDVNSLRSLLVSVIGGDPRLQSYYQLGNLLGEAIDLVERDAPPLSDAARRRILSGLTGLPLQEQREIELILRPTAKSLFVLARQMKHLSRYLKSHEQNLTATPKWDGQTIAYRGQSEEVKIQANGVLTLILDEGERQGWPDRIRPPAGLLANKKAVANAVDYFHGAHNILEWSVNGDRVMWSPPGTVKRSQNQDGAGQAEFRIGVSPTLVILQPFRLGQGFLSPVQTSKRCGGGRMTMPSLEDLTKQAEYHQHPFGNDWQPLDQRKCPVK